MRFLDTTDTKFMKIRFQTFKKRSDALKSRSRIKNNKRYTFIALLKKESEKRDDGV